MTNFRQFILTVLAALAIMAVGTRSAYALWKGLDSIGAIWGSPLEACQSWIPSTRNPPVLRIDLVYAVNDDGQSGLVVGKCWYPADCCNQINSAPIGIECSVVGSNLYDSGCASVLEIRRALGAAGGGSCSASPDGNTTGGTNPISLLTGNKFEAVTDFESAGPGRLALRRYYNGRSVETGVLGTGWRTNFEHKIVASGALLYLHRADGKVVEADAASLAAEKFHGLDIRDTGGGWEVRDPSGTKEVYDSSGVLTAIVDPGDYQQTLSYDVNGRLETVIDSFGREIRFTYTAQDRVESVTDPDGNIYRYRYESRFVALGLSLDDNEDRLVRVELPDATPWDPADGPFVQYLYEDSRYPYALTGIIDETGARVATWDYDDELRAISSEHAPGADLYSVLYDDVANTRTVTNPLGKAAIYHFFPEQGGLKLGAIEGQPSPNCPASDSALTYNVDGLLQTLTDNESNVTTYGYDPADGRGLVTTKTEATGQPEQRITTTERHADFPLPTKIIEPRRTTDLLYNPAGRVISRTVTDTTTHTVPYPTAGEQRAWTYDYWPDGLLKSVDGPLLGTLDTTSYDYDTLGNLTQVTSPLGHVTEILEHNLRGQPTLIRDVNGLETELAYDPRGRLARTTARAQSGDVTTAFGYDDAGRLATITSPIGGATHYLYDDSGRVIEISNDLGERIEYDPDPMGNITAVRVKDQGGAIVRTLSRQFDELGRLLTSLGAAAQTTIYGYDKNDNLTSVIDPLGNPTDLGYDGLDRLVTQSDALLNSVDIERFADDSIDTVTDQRLNPTLYVYNGFGDLIQIDSPDTGVTVFEVDALGNVELKTDANGTATVYTYDLEGRVLTMSASAASGGGGKGGGKGGGGGGATYQVTYAYDDATPGNFGLGRLASVSDPSGATLFSYDDLGNVVEETRTIAGIDYVTGYGYDRDSNPVSIAYPTGQVVEYVRDERGRVSAVSLRQDATASPFELAREISYLPFGGIASLTFGNGVVVDYGYDQDGRLTGIVADDGLTTVEDTAYALDAAGNVTAVTDLLDPARDQAFLYDPLHRLAQGVGAYGQIDYAYDPAGNRLTRILDNGVTAVTESYQTDPLSNRLESVSDGSTTRTFAHDANGNLVADQTGGGGGGGGKGGGNKGGAGTAYAYELDNRLAQVEVDGGVLAIYRTNAFGERVAKEAIDGLEITHFHYGRGGELLAESDDFGALKRAWIYLGRLPIALIVPGGGGGAAVDVVVDNSDPGASFVGPWTTATQGTGYEGADYALLPGTGEVPANGTVIDNTDAGFTATGPWATRSDGTGFEGVDYRRLDFTAPSGAYTEIDDGDPGFGTVGAWGYATGVSGSWNLDHFGLAANTGDRPGGAPIDNGDLGFATLEHALGLDDWVALGDCSVVEFCLGADYLRHLSSGISPDAILIDDGDPGFGTTGDWAQGSTSVAGYWGEGYLLWLPGSTPPGTATWTPALPQAEQYRVYARWRASNFASNNTTVTYTIDHDGGTSQVPKSQMDARGTWVLLGTFAMTPGMGHRVVLSDEPADGGSPVIADAMVFAPLSGARNSAIWTPTLAAPDSYDVYASWAPSVIYATDAPYTVYHAGGSTTVRVDQRFVTNRWYHLGRFDLAPGMNHRVELTDDAGGTFVAADAVDFVPASASLQSAAWALEVAAPDYYELEAWWRQSFGNTAYAWFTVDHAGGADAFMFSQQANGSRWNALGTFALAPGAGHRVVLDDRALWDGFLVADAVRYRVSPTALREATWPVSVTTSGLYRLYARWPARTDNAIDAVYTVHHAGGASAVTVNQRTGGSGWNLLGTFSLTGGAAHKVVLTSATNGAAVADAIYVVADEELATASFSWMPALPAAADYVVYAKWMAGGGRGLATYRVYHAGGSTDVVIDQRSGGGVWTPLGSFSLDPALAPEVELLGSGGSLSADAVRFVDAVSATAAPTNVSYVHTDHLGTPRKLTDAAANTVWDHQTTPFGETVALAGLADVNLRFPGQYFDQESGLHYNYFRDYDPSTGRYIESDPIGLAGGINTYAYVGGNPVNFSDPYGLGPEGAAIGAAIGGGIGGLLGGLIGGGACTLVLPGGGTIICIGPGILEGIEIGAMSGAVIGNAIQNICEKNSRFDDCRDQWIDDTKWCDNNFTGTKNIACHSWADDEFARCREGTSREPFRL